MISALTFKNNEKNNCMILFKTTLDLKGIIRKTILDIDCYVWY
jgi:hypothetical protein